MDEEYVVFRDYLRRLPRPKTKKLCQLCGLTEEESRLVTMYYSDKLSEDYIADCLNVSKSTYHRMRKAQIERIRRQLHLDVYRPEVTSFKDRIRLIDELLYKK